MVGVYSYFPDGSGRDCYVSADKGGNIKSNFTRSPGISARDELTQSWNVHCKGTMPPKRYFPSGCRDGYIALGQMRKYDYLHDLRAPRSATHLFPHNSKLSTPAERGMAEHQRMASARLASPRVESVVPLRQAGSRPKSAHPSYGRSSTPELVRPMTSRCFKTQSKESQSGFRPSMDSQIRSIGALMRVSTFSKPSTPTKSWK
mmetsp:Transcript_41384/g.69224  ORF Transcript_41384/g.69224 Transcript_41384/m.69224 type:complete len:203 (-) Transcript_41384:279-887(-)